MTPRKKHKLTLEERIHKIKDNLAMILRSTGLLLRNEKWFSTEGRERLEEIKKQARGINEHIDKIL